MQNRPDRRALLDEYRVPGFKTLARVEGCEEGCPAFVITLARRQKKQHAAAAERFVAASTTGADTGPVILVVAIAKSTSTSRCVVSTARRAA